MLHNPDSVAGVKMTLQICVEGVNWIKNISLSAGEAITFESRLFKEAPKRTMASVKQPEISVQSWQGFAILHFSSPPLPQQKGPEDRGSTLPILCTERPRRHHFCQRPP
jgi:hypothetical protein